MEAVVMQPVVNDTPTPELKRKADQALSVVGAGRMDIARYLDRLENELAKARGELAKYGDHLTMCRLKYGGPRCNCGYVAASKA